MQRTIQLLKESEAMLEGHFLLSSGRHSDRYFQCARLLMHPERAEEAMMKVAARLREELASGGLDFDLVVGPAMGGILPAWVIGKALGLPAIFTERDDEGKMALRRGFELYAGQKVLIVEDVVTTGKSSGECAQAIRAAGGSVVALACVVDRRAEGVPVEWPIFAAATIPATSWDVGECPLCAKDLPFVKPGSRKMPGA
ncbi:MAG: orotate phosphoribosyltransferase [Spirochaetota bacterium]